RINKYDDNVENGNEIGIDENEASNSYKFANIGLGSGNCCQNGLGDYDEMCNLDQCHDNVVGIEKNYAERVLT
ncbi:463_t:CDS:1, partial [Dentiscutata erythropus]